MFYRFDESSSDKEILDLLLEKKRYDKRLLPPVNGKKFQKLSAIFTLLRLNVQFYQVETGEKLHTVFVPLRVAFVRGVAK